MATGLEHDFELMPHLETTPIPRPAVLKAMSSVLESKPFRTSKQCQNFLRYVVLNTVEGRDEALKERVIGAAVLERSPDYNTADDPVVRIRAADVRKRLAMYYQDEGHEAPVRITIPSGSYRAFFHHGDAHLEPSNLHPDSAHPDPVRSDPFFEEPRLPAVIEALERLPAEPATAAPVEAKAGAEAASNRPGKGNRRVLAFALVALFVLFAGLAAWHFKAENQREFNLFWAPTLDQPRPPILYVGSNAVYRLSDGFLQRYEANHPDYNGLESLPAIDRTESIRGSDLNEDDKDFVGLGDVAAAVSISPFFKGRDVRYDLRFGRDIVFGDFRTTPVVLIGAFNNSWTLELNDKMPYRFTASNGIKRLEGPGHSWQTWYGADGVPREDYAVITREISPKSGEPVIAVAGLDQTGTRAAAEFVSTPALLDAALRKLPAGWQNKKVQLVLHATIVDYVPTGYDVIASSVQ
jgi:hypothetical protein